MIKVSVIVPVYNVDPYLVECLDSIINQTLKEIEIICVDDCSTDNSYMILEEYSKKDSRIKLIKHKENRGLGPARNTGIENATGEYISFIDSDDYVSLDFLENLYSTAKKFDLDISITQNVIENDNSNYRNLFFSEKELREYDCEYILSSFSLQCFYIRGMNFITHNVWTKLYRREFIKDLFFLDIKYGAEDADFNFRVFLNNPKIGFNNNSKYFYRLRFNSLTDLVGKSLDSLNSAIKHMNNSIKYCEDFFPLNIEDLYICVFYVIFYYFNKADNISKKYYYTIVHNFMLSINIKRDFNNYTDYILIRNNHYYNDYMTLFLYKENNILKKQYYFIQNELYRLNNKYFNLLNRIAWFIPIKKWRDKFRESILAEQSRAEQSRAELKILEYRFII